MKLLFTILAAIGLCGVVYAGDDMAATRLHTMSNDYDAINGGDADFVRPLQEIAIKFEAPIERIGTYKSGKAILVKMSKAEARRVEALRQKLITMYVKDYAGCKINPKARWELIVACDPDTGLTDGEKQIKEMSSEEGVNLNSLMLTYPVVHGWYCLVDKKTKTAFLDKEVTGSGAVIDTALDDFSTKLVFDFAANVKEK